MKNIFILYLLLFGAFTLSAVAQTDSTYGVMYQGRTTSRNMTYGLYGADSGIVIKPSDTNSHSLPPGTIRYRTDFSRYVWTGVYWRSENGEWANIPGKPESFTPAAHSHPISDINSLQTLLDQKTDSNSLVQDSIFDWAAGVKRFIGVANPYIVNVARYGVSSSKSMLQNRTAFNNATAAAYAAGIAEIYTPSLGNVYVDSIRLYPGQTLFGSSGTVLIDTNNSRLIIMDNFCKVRGLKIRLASPAVIKPLNTGIYAGDSKYGIVIEDNEIIDGAGDTVSTSDAGGAGIFLYRTGPSFSSNRGFRVIGNKFYNCRVCINAGSRSEYGLIWNNNGRGSLWGLFQVGGNLQVFANDFSSNRYPSYRVPGSNGGHSICIGNDFNHGTKVYNNFGGGTGGLGDIWEGNKLYGVDTFQVENADIFSMLNCHFDNTGLYTTILTNCKVLVREACKWPRIRNSRTIVSSGQNFMAFHDMDDLNPVNRSISVAQKGIVMANDTGLLNRIELDSLNRVIITKTLIDLMASAGAYNVVIYDSVNQVIRRMPFSSLVSALGFPAMGTANQVISVNTGGTGYENRSFAIGTSGASPNWAFSLNQMLLNIPIHGNGITGLLTSTTQDLYGRKYLQNGGGSSTFVIGGNGVDYTGGFQLSAKGNSRIENLFLLDLATRTPTADDSVLTLNAGSAVRKSRIFFEGRNSTASTSYTLVAGDGNRVVGMTDPGARSVSLSAASTYPVGVPYIIKDEAGTAGTANIVITPNGSEKIDNASNYTINTNHGGVTIYTNGTNWFTIR